MVTEALAFLGVCAVVICTPGPDTALTIRNSIVGGRRGGVLTAAGVASGQLVWTVAASVGIAGLLQASQPAFTALKIIGAAYLAFLGVQSILAALRRHGNVLSATWPIPRWRFSSSVCFLSSSEILLAVSRRSCRLVPRSASSHLAGCRSTQ
jgi:threonine/homoserine/homoserine lactone efflux protein